MHWKPKECCRGCKMCHKHLGNLREYRGFNSCRDFGERWAPTTWSIDYLRMQTTNSHNFNPWTQEIMTGWIDLNAFHTFFCSSCETTQNLRTLSHLILLLPRTQNADAAVNFAVDLPVACPITECLASAKLVSACHRLWLKACPHAEYTFFFSTWLKYFNLVGSNQQTDVALAVEQILKDLGYWARI